LQQLAAAAAAHPSPLRLAGDEGSLRSYSHPNARGHVRRASDGAPDTPGLWVGANLAGLTFAPVGGRLSGLLSGGDDQPGGVSRRSSGLTPGQEVGSPSDLLVLFRNVLQASKLGRKSMRSTPDGQQS